MLERLTKEEQEFFQTYPILSDEKEIAKFMMMEYRIKDNLRFSLYVQE